ncbi:hypothetical protein EV182_000552 [Spiromyces aspiralis]|uniref:Uncharacterized protein n=1 Tax=Spiromyces aspiralis TaxID=68401 RepID=A0ACC1HJ70_9FUNG|nr:hypothetical protein EV182_000552 [Spiromyces aspiralis]
MPLHSQSLFKSSTKPRRKDARPSRQLLNLSRFFSCDPHKASAKSFLKDVALADGGSDPYPEIRTSIPLSTRSVSQTRPSSPSLLPSVGCKPTASSSLRYRTAAAANRPQRPNTSHHPAPSTSAVNICSIVPLSSSSSPRCRPNLPLWDPQSSHSATPAAAFPHHPRHRPASSISARDPDTTTLSLNQQPPHQRLQRDRSAPRPRRHSVTVVPGPTPKPLPHKSTPLAGPASGPCLDSRPKRTHDPEDGCLYLSSETANNYQSITVVDGTVYFDLPDGGISNASSKSAANDTASSSRSLAAATGDGDTRHEPVVAPVQGCDVDTEDSDQEPTAASRNCNGGDEIEAPGSPPPDKRSGQKSDTVKSVRSIGVQTSYSRHLTGTELRGNGRYTKVSSYWEQILLRELDLCQMNIIQMRLHVSAILDTYDSSALDEKLGVAPLVSTGCSEPPERVERLWEVWRQVEALLAVINIEMSSLGNTKKHSGAHDNNNNGGNNSSSSSRNGKNKASYRYFAGVQEYAEYVSQVARYIMTGCPTLVLSTLDSEELVLGADTPSTISTATDSPSLQASGQSCGRDADDKLRIILNPETLRRLVMLGEFLLDRASDLIDGIQADLQPIC